MATAARRGGSIAATPPNKGPKTSNPSARIIVTRMRVGGSQGTEMRVIASDGNGAIDLGGIEIDDLRVHFG